MTTIERINQLEKEIADLRLIVLEIFTPEWPQKEDKYWYVTSNGDSEDTVWVDVNIDKGRKEMGNVFRTKHEAVNHRLRLQSMANRWKPGRNDEYFTWSHDVVSDTFTFTNHASDWNIYHLGRCFKTEKEASAHRDLYKAAWTALEEQE